MNLYIHSSLVRSTTTSSPRQCRKKKRSIPSSPPSLGYSLSSSHLSASLCIICQSTGLLVGRRNGRAPETRKTSGISRELRRRMNQRIYYMRQVIQGRYSQGVAMVSAGWKAGSTSTPSTTTGSSRYPVATVNQGCSCRLVAPLHGPCSAKPFSSIQDIFCRG